MHRVGRVNLCCSEWVRSQRLSRRSLGACLLRSSPILCLSNQSSRQTTAEREGRADGQRRRGGDKVKTATRLRIERRAYRLCSREMVKRGGGRRPR
jgi:hypothetical protein